MLTLMLGAVIAAQAAAPVPPTPQAARPGERREVIVVREVGRDGKVTERRTEQVAGGGRELPRRQCAGRKFEVDEPAAATGNARQRTRILICGEGQNDARWAQTLRDAARRIEGSADMSPEVKTRVLAALNAEISRLPTGR